MSFYAPVGNKQNQSSSGKGNDSTNLVWQARQQDFAEPFILIRSPGPLKASNIKYPP